MLYTFNLYNFLSVLYISIKTFKDGFGVIWQEETFFNEGNDSGGVTDIKYFGISFVMQFVFYKFIKCLNSCIYC
jgi:hypothetical protein